MNNNLSTMAIVVVLVHLVVSGIHGLVHLVIPVPVSLLQAVYIGGVITLMPLLAVRELTQNHFSRGFWLLFGSMLGSLLFGVYNHFIAISPDHVAHVPDHSTVPVFQATALTIMLLEAIGIVIGTWGILPQVHYEQS